jgi:hypothetical protein
MKLNLQRSRHMSLRQSRRDRKRKLSKRLRNLKRRKHML